MYSKDHLETLFIEKLLYGGSGLSHIGSMACFIDDVIPGETVSATITTVKKQYVTASLTEICESSPHRINPICAYFKYCGGCQWQHIDYHYQLHWKRLIVEDCLNRIGRMSDAAVLEIIPSDSQFQYRSRTNLKVSSSGIGYHQRGTRNIIPVSCCPLLPPSLNQALSYATNLHSKNTSLFKGITEIQLLLINRTQQVIISLLNESELKATLLYTPGGTTDVSINDIFLTASEHSYCDIISGITFYRSPLTFYQVNSEQNAVMINIVRNFLSEPGNGKVLDLYCGCGNFSLFLSQMGMQVVGIDSSNRAIKEACKNVEANRLQHCTYICGNVDNKIKQFSTAAFNSVLINPPRRGCTHETLDYIRQLHPQTIVYVSCNPATLARDLNYLIDNGYLLDTVQPVDMFPHTYHIETIVKLIQS